jgi:hypothetical protein
VSVREQVESSESFVIQVWWPDSRRVTDVDLGGHGNARSLLGYFAALPLAEVYERPPADPRWFFPSLAFSAQSHLALETQKDFESSTPARNKLGRSASAES